MSVLARLHNWARIAVVIQSAEFAVSLSSAPLEAGRDGTTLFRSDGLSRVETDEAGRRSVSARTQLRGASTAIRFRELGLATALPPHFATRANQSSPNSCAPRNEKQHHGRRCDGTAGGSSHARLRPSWPRPSVASPRVLENRDMWIAAERRSGFGRAGLAD